MNLQMTAYITRFGLRNDFETEPREMKFGKMVGYKVGKMQLNE